MSAARDNSSDLPAALTDPAAYPHVVTGEIRLIETHISWVLVAPPWAYKIKRPVVFDFLDFRSVADRRRYCEEEVRLNRRFAPDIYHDVVSVTRDEVGIRIGGSGPVIDYAVRMAAFDAADELKALLQARRVDPEELAALARDVAAFQGGSESRQSGALGDPAAIIGAALANFASLRASPVGRDSAGDLDALEKWTRERVQVLLPVMHQRRRERLVRDGHGDLHAGNIVRWRGRLVPFDCIEFNPALRCLDVVSDVAFLVMDLHSRGCGQLAQVFLNEWLTATGDFAGLRLLPFHVVYLSLVRAKVDALQLKDADGDRAIQLRERIGHHLRLALEWTESRRRWLILMHGVSGSGKSWLAARLAPLIPAVIVRADVERKRLAGVGALARTSSGPGAGIYTTAFSDRTYARMLQHAGAALAGGEHVIVDATFPDLRRRQPFRELASRQRAALVMVDCAPEVEVCRARVLAREASGADASEAGMAVLNDQLTRTAPLSADEKRLAVIVTDAMPDAVQVARRIVAIAQSSP